MASRVHWLWRAPAHRRWSPRHDVGWTAEARDQLDIEWFAQGLEAGTPPVARFVFEADGGLTLTAAELHQRMRSGTEGNDTLIGLRLDETLDGGQGDDVLSVNGPSAILLGGQGRDTLFGAAAENMFRGGTGDDVMVAASYYDWMASYQGASNDTYLFDRGDGADVIFDIEAAFVDTPETHNVLRLGKGISPGDLDVYLVQRQDPFFKEAARASIVLSCAAHRKAWCWWARQTARSGDISTVSTKWCSTTAAPGTVLH
ncbi:MAG: hypothetical protein QM742_09780 [Aquabacterium sp.]